MRSVCLSILALLLLTPAVFGQDANPFAEWDSLNRKAGREAGKSANKSDASPATGARPATRVEYFTPDMPVRNTADRQTARRERLKTAPKTQPAQTAPKSQDAEPLVADPGQSARVTVAAFSGDTSASETSAAIQQTADSTANPFAEFLPESAPAEPQPAPAEEPEVAADPIEQPATAAVSQVRLPATASGPQTPSVTLEWEHHDELSVGQRCRCDLVVRNTGRTLVQNVLTDVEVPTGLQVVQADPEPAVVAGNAQWKFDSLAPGDEQRIQLVVVPREQGDVQLNAYVRLTSAVSSSHSVTQPLVAIKLEGPPTVEVGQQLAYTVHVTNPGTGTARNVTIQAAVPEGLQHRQGRLLNIDIGTLNPGELRRARLSLTAITGGTHELAVRVVADGGLSEDSSQQVAVAEPKLNIGLRGPKVAKTGQAGTYELVVVNEGNVDSNNVRTKYKVPAGFQFETADAGGKYNHAERSVEWFLGTLEPNQVRQLKVTLRAAESGARTHQVGVISEHGRMTMAEHETKVEGFAELKLQVAAVDSETQAGAENVVTVRIENAGTSAASSVGLSCELPPGLQLVDISGPSEFIADSGVIIFRKLPQIEAGEVTEFRIRTRCERPGTHRVRARVASQSIREPLIGEGAIVGR